MITSTSSASATSRTASQTVLTSFAVCAWACSPAAVTSSTPAPAVAPDSASALSSAAPSSAIRNSCTSFSYVLLNWARPTTARRPSAGAAGAAGVELAAAAGLDASAHTAKLVTTVWEAVLEVADALDAAVIITGTRSLHGVREIVSNTLSHSLIQHSARPVLAIPMPVS